MSTTSIGRQAETKAATYLTNLDYKVLVKNWRTRFCEIDIVARKNNRVYFVEVKYRKSSDWGGGVDYITSKKLKQMSFAAELWVASNNWQGDYQLAVIEVSGSDFEVTNFLIDF